MKVIKGTPNIKSVVDLYTIKKQVTKTSKFTIQDSEYWNSDVQAAVKMGLITSEDVPTAATTAEEDKPVRCKNTHSRSINILARPTPVGPGAEFTLTQKEIQHPDIQVAIAKKMITPIESCDKPAKDVSEGVLTVSKIIAREENKSKLKQRKAQQERQETTRRRHIDLETNDEVPPLANVITEEKPAPVKAPDERKKSIVWNPTREKTTETAKRVPRLNLDDSQSNGVITSDEPEAVDANQNDPRRKSVVIADHNEEITFVDEKQEIDRIKSHPKLKSKPLPKQEDVDLIDPDEERRMKHPKLKNQKPSGEIDFVS